MLLLLLVLVVAVLLLQVLLAELLEAEGDLLVGCGECLVAVVEGEYFHLEVVVLELLGLVVFEGASVLLSPLLLLLGEVFDAVHQRLLARDHLRQSSRHRLHHLAAQLLQLLL